MGCISSKNCCDPDSELPGHEICTGVKKTRRQRSRHYSNLQERKGRRASNTSSSSRNPMIQRDSVAEMRDMIASMGGWHESAHT
ncbi:uncharacterized protein IL334_000890 [Kwoniella shivajii]|uniref:BZIP domain-containing protein n=1 Tax=Kwoniella shivajii TaxID=564305 RepID=A0ABZ1CQL1_9TREE|nr:hypothetical protein IL334_000890 [Kwoniella shivajii]